MEAAAMNCEQCGAQLSLPTDRCQACGHVPGGTIDPRYKPDPLRTTPPPPAHPTVPQEGPADEAARVELLLGRIAGQSHFEERYIIRGELARGGMGQVYRGYDQILRREVAIKMMHAHLGGPVDGTAARGQFLKEARVGGRLLHPNILSVFDLGVNRADRIYYTMRLVDGASLQHCLDAVDKGVVTKLISYPLRRIIEAFVGACQGVDYAHQQGVIHLDLKPHNILVSGFNEVFVIDWGLARVDEADDTEELAGLYRRGGDEQNTTSSTGVFGDRVVGTPGYMAPEQARGTAALFNPATDVYGLGGVLHFILYGLAPNQGASVGAVLEASAVRKKCGKLRSGVLPRGQRVRKEAQAAIEALEAVCMKALEPRPQDRYQSVEEMIVELNEWLTATPGPPLGF